MMLRMAAVATKAPEVFLFSCTPPGRLPDSWNALSMASYHGLCLILHDSARKYEKESAEIKIWQVFGYVRASTERGFVLHTAAGPHSPKPRQPRHS